MYNDIFIFVPEKRNYPDYKKHWVYQKKQEIDVFQEKICYNEKERRR